MKRLLLILILTFSFQSWTKADDIRDFEIEGMSVGENLLDHFNKEELNLFAISFGTAHSGIEVSSHDKNQNNYYSLKKYDGLQVSYIKDSNIFYRIIGFSGTKWYHNDIKNCLKKKDEIKPDIETFLKSSIIDTFEEGKQKHWYDKSGKSFTYGTNYSLINDDVVYLDCFDWSDEMKFRDHLRITFSSSEYIDLVNNDYNK